MLSIDTILRRMKEWDDAITFSFYDNEDITKILPNPIKGYNSLNHGSQTVRFRDDGDIDVDLYDRDDNDPISYHWINVPIEQWKKLLCSVFTLYPQVTTDLYLVDLMDEPKHRELMKRLIPEEYSNIRTIDQLKDYLTLHPSSFQIRDDSHYDILLDEILAAYG